MLQVVVPDNDKDDDDDDGEAKENEYHSNSAFMLRNVGEC
jgi:hypothetical protein